MRFSNIGQAISTAVLNMVFIFGIIRQLYDIVCQNRAGAGIDYPGKHGVLPFLSSRKSDHLCLLRLGFPTGFPNLPRFLLRLVYNRMSNSLY
jgi:hypothetical protein